MEKNGGTRARLSIAQQMRGAMAGGLTANKDDTANTLSAERAAKAIDYSGNIVFSHPNQPNRRGCTSPRRPRVLVALVVGVIGVPLPYA